MKPVLGLALLCCVMLMFAGCGDEKSSAGDASAEPVVYATNYPLAYFAERIAGDTIPVVFPEIDGDPAFWQPSDEHIAAMQSATLILTNGATYEKWAKTASLPSAKTVDTSASFADAFIEINEAKTHSHGGDGEHSHAGTAFTTWMDFEQAKRQAQAVRDAMIMVVPEEVATLNANAEALFADLDALHAATQRISATIDARPLMASHPVYQYFARQYGLNIKAVLWEPETVSGDEDMAGLESILANHQAKWMLWEGTPATQSVEMLETIGVRSVVVDPAGNRPEDGDWLSVMRQNVENLKAIAGNAPE